MPHTINIITLFRSGVNSNFFASRKKFLKKCLTNETHGDIMTKLSKRQAIKLVLIAARVHPFPYRTRKLSSLALKILGGKLPGKISRCQHTKPYIMYGFFVFTAYYRAAHGDPTIVRTELREKQTVL